MADRHLAEQLSEVGVIVLMFGVGLHFHIEDAGRAADRRARGGVPALAAPPTPVAVAAGRPRRPRPRLAGTPACRPIRAVVVGYGPVGRTLSRLLRDNDIEPTIVEMNLETVRQLREEGVAAVYGDAGHRDTLEAAGVGRAAGLLLTASGLRNAAEIIRLARELNPRVRVLVRCSYLREQAALLKAGADEVFSGEGGRSGHHRVRPAEAGATSEQIDRERDRVRADLFGRPASADAGRPHDGSPTVGSAVPQETLEQQQVVIEDAAGVQGEPRQVAEGDGSRAHSAVRR